MTQVSPPNDGSASTNILPLWDSVKELYDGFDLETFRAIGGVNDRLGIWSAKDKNTRYYKSLMYEFAIYLNEFFCSKRVVGGETITDSLNKIKNQNLGSPLTIHFESCDVSLDYLLGLEEYIFCSDELSEVNSVCEIGAGFGRTCHTFISLSDIQSYTIIDLPEVLALSKAYLSQVLDDSDFRKITFVTADNFHSVDSFDLAINVDSLQEMPNEVGVLYLEFISEKAKLFFTKNVMGKYSPSDIDLEIINKSQYESAMQMGLMTDKLKLFDSNARKDSVKIYHKKFCPKGFCVRKSDRFKFIG